MKKQTTRESYEDRFDRVISHLYDHLDDEIDFNHLAEIACLSPYHWHRIYHAVFGETIAATVKRLRLHRAAGLLAHTAIPVGEVAKRSGYANVQSFTRIFRAVYRLPPAHYRRAGSHAEFKAQSKQRNAAMFNVAINDIPPMTGAGVEHKGSYMEIGKAFETLFANMTLRGLMQPDMRMVGIYFDDPSRTAIAEMRSLACLTSESPIETKRPLQPAEIAGGTCAVLRYKGHYSTMDSAYDWLFGTWLPQSGKEAADAPVFEIYVNNPRDTPPTELLTDICVTLQD